MSHWCASPLNRLLSLPRHSAAMENSPNLQHQTASAELAQARSDLLDAFADIEAKIARMVKAASGSAHLSARITLFRKLEPCSSLSKTNLPKRDKMADELESLLPLRADIVHSRLETVMIGGSVAAKFVNAQHRHEDHPPCRLLFLADIRKLTTKVHAIHKDLSNLNRPINSPSSPLPPSRDEAAGP